jgi:tetratricopeptide (TPR) repeat protein
MRKLIREAHRRSLWQVLGLYLAGSWVSLQVVREVTESVGLPEWVPGLAIIILVIGLPVVLATAFVQEGISTAETPREETAREPAADTPAAVTAVAAQPATAAAAQPASAPSATKGTHHRLFTWRNAIVGGALAFAVGGLLTVGYVAMRNAGIGPAGTLVAKGVLEERAPILLADFRADSGDEELARMATDAFRIDFGQSQVVSLLQPTEVANVLTRMGRERDTPMDPDLAREAAIREGIPAYISGTVNSAGGTFVVSAELVAAEGGEVLVPVRETAKDSTEIIDAIDRLSSRLRERIGESLRLMHGEEPLARVTTPSLTALQRYSQALYAEDVLGDQDRAIALLEEAVAIDTAFAMAYRKLGAIIGNRGTQRARTVEALSKAYQHRDRLTERERYHAEALYHFNVTTEIEKAINPYRSLIELDPDDRYALNNLGVVYAFLRDHERAEELYQEAIRADSATASTSWQNAVQEQVSQNRIEDARATLEAYAAKFPGNPRVTEYRALFAASLGDYEGATARVREWREQSTGSLYDHWQTSWDLAVLSATGGKLAVAGEHMADALSADEERDSPGEYLLNATELAQWYIDVHEDDNRAREIVEAALQAHPLAELDPLDRPFPVRRCPGPFSRLRRGILHRLRASRDRPGV